LVNMTMKIFVRKALLSFLLFAPILLHARTSVLIHEKKSNPLVYTRVVFAGGNALEKHPGEAYLLGVMLQYSPLSQILEEKGATLEALAEYDYFSLSFEMLSLHQKKTFERVLRFLVSYSPSSQGLELAKFRVRQQLAIQKDDFYHVVRRAFTQRLYGKHRYAQENTGTLESLKEITLEDMVRFYKRLLNRKRMTLIMTGNIDATEASDYDDQIRLLPDEVIMDEKEMVSMPEQQKDESFTIKAPVTQTFVRIGTLGVPRNHPHYLDYLIMSDMIGGGFGSLLMRQLREEKGLTYSPVANFYSLRREKGYFFVAYSTRPENLRKSLGLVRGIFTTLQSQGINFHNFSLSCRYLYGILLNQQESNAGMAGILTEAAVFDLPLDYWQQDQRRLREMILENEKFEKAGQKELNSATHFQRVNQRIREFFKASKWLQVILQAQG